MSTDGRRNLVDVLGSRPCYEVHKRPDDNGSWKYNLAVGRVQHYNSKSPYYVVVYADWGAPTELIFAFPSEYLNAEVFPRLIRRDGRRYMFQVDKLSLEFTWQIGVKVDGRAFRVTRSSLYGAAKGGHLAR